MYKKIAEHPGTRQRYADKLVAQGVLSDDEPAEMVKQYRRLMEDGNRTIEHVLTDYKNKYATDWTPFLDAKWTDHADTAVPLAELKRIGERITTVPEGFEVHNLLNRLLNDRRAMARGEANVDWGMAEHLAFGTLVANRSEEHTSELQSRGHLVCRHLLEKKKEHRLGRGCTRCQQA